MSDQHANLDSLFEAAIEIESTAEREAFLDKACGKKRELRRQVERLLQSHEQASSFLEKPPADLKATTNSTGENLGGLLDRGLAAEFGEESPAVENASYGVLQSLGATMDVRRVVLRESKAEGTDPITRPNSPEMPGRAFQSRYQLQGEIARGGMGAIIKGRDTDLGRDLAIVAVYSVKLALLDFGVSVTTLAWMWNNSGRMSPTAM